MLLKISISNTKKFLQKTMDNFKSFLSTGNTYEKLPKTTNIEACNKELDNFYVEFTNQWDSNKGKLRNRALKKPRNSQEVYNSAKETSRTYELDKRKLGGEETERVISRDCHEENSESMRSKSCMSVVRGFKQSELCSRSVRERRLDIVEQKLKELQMIDKGSFEHKMDVEEVLHYYSRLTCPAYLDIVDKFFQEICTEFLGNQMSTTSVHILRPTL